MARRFSRHRAGRVRDRSAVSAKASARLRQASRADVPGMQRVRRAVRENRLVSITISDEEVVDAIERTGRGWVVEDGGEVVAFAIGNAESGNIWALFVDPGHEGRGYGRRLHDEMLAWLWSRGVERAWLSTAPATRAERFYEKAGWRRCGVSASGELLLEKRALANPEAETFFLSRSARDEVGMALIDSLKKCGEHEVRGDLRIYKSPYAVTANIVFGGAAGMRDTFWRLRPRDRAIALESGAREAEIGPAWVRIELWRPNWPAPDLAHWALAAYDFARRGDTD